MNFVSKFDGGLPFAGAHPKAQTHVDSVSTKAPADAIVVKDADLLFNGDFKRAGSDLVITRDDHELVLADYFKGEKRALASPDGAYLTGKIVDALTGYVQVAQADPGASAAKIIGHVTKLTGNATVLRNGVSVILNNGDNVYQGDVVQCGSSSSLGITFIDGSVFGLGSNAKMVLNEMVYDPNGSNNSSLMSLVSGTISFVAGATAKHGDMKVDTPVATMGIRGTAVLVEIDFEVTSPGSAPPARFQVLVEPDGTTGSYVLLDRVTLAPIATVNQAGTVTTVSGQGTVSFLASAQLSPEAMKLISEVFSQRFTDNTNPKSDTHFTDTVVPQTSFPVKFADGGTGTATITVTPATEKSGGSTGGAPASKDHIPGAPLVATFDKQVAEQTALTGSSLIDKTSGQVSYADPNAVDVPTVSTVFSRFEFHNADGQDVTAGLSAAQRSAIAAVSVPLTVVQDPAAKNTGAATWTYQVPDHALDFLAAGETLTLTYTARVDNNFQLNNEFAFKTFTITITGTNDTPTIVVDATNAAGGVVEDTDVNASGNITANGTIVFNDVDLTDTHTATFVLKSSDASADLPGFVEGVGPGAAHIGTFALVPISEIAGDGDTTGSLGWTFTLDDDDPVLQSLAAGQTITQVYTITVSDGHGGTVTQDVTITITGSNDTPNHAPVIVGELTTATGEVTEDTDIDASNQIAADGTIVFKDIDLIDTHTASFAPKSSTSDVHLPGFEDGVDYIGTFALAPVDENNTDTNPIGSVGWTFTLPDDDPFLQSLAAGQTITQVYTVTIDDGHNPGGTVTQDVTITITGVNDIPVVYTTDGCVFEKSYATGSADDDTTSGTVSFTDVDLIDTHDVTVKSVSASGVTSGAPDNATMLNWLSLGPLTDATGGGTGSTAWTLKARDYYFDYLADGEDLVLAYTIQVDDHNGGVVEKQVTVTVHGSNDAPELAADTSGVHHTALHCITEQVGVTNGQSKDTASGSLTFNDVDLSDTHSVGSSAPTFAWSNSYGKTLSVSEMNGLAAASTFALKLHESTGTGHGSVDFSYSAEDHYFDFLAEGETLTITYDVTVEDEHHLTSTRPVTITVTGTNDAPVAVADVDSGHIVEAGHDANNNVVPGVATTTGNVLDNDTDVDVTDTHNVVGVASGTATGVLSGNVGTTIKGIYGSLNLKADGSWTYALDNDDPDTNALPAGTHVADVFSYTETDHHGGTSTATLTIDITGTNDKPVAAADVNEGPPVVEAGVGPGNTPVVGVATATGNVLANDYDVDAGDTKSVQSVVHGGTTCIVEGPNGTQIGGRYGILTIYADGTWSYALANDSTVTQPLTAGQHVADVFEYVMRDKLGSTSSATLSIDITGTNDAPTVTAALTASAYEGDSSFTRDLLSGASDIDDGETATLSIANVTYKVNDGAASASAPAGLSISGSTLSVDPGNPAFNYLAEGAETTILVAYDVKDAHGAIVHQTETITIKGTNDKPTVAAALTAAAHEGDPAFARNLLSGASDPDDGETSTLSISNVNYQVDGGAVSATAPAGVCISGHTLNVDPGNPAFNHLAEGVKEVISISYDVKDVHGATVHQTETVTITGTNDAPSIVSEVNPLAHAVMVVNPISPVIEPAGQNTNTLGLSTEDFNQRTAGSASNNGTNTGNFSSYAIGATFSASGHAGIVHGSSSVSAAPFMGPLPGGADTTNYLSIGAGATETITFASAKNAFGLYWGSVDPYNSIKFYDAQGHVVASYTGSDIAPLLASGNQGSFAANGYVEFAGLPFFTKVVLGSSSNAFEVDNISAGVVPAVHAVVGTVCGTMSVHDPDIGDTLTGLVTGKATALYNNSSTLPNGVNVNDLIKAGNITFDSVTSDGGTDVLHWSYDPHGANLDFLKAGDTLKLIYTAQVSDGHGSTGNQQLVITLVGADNETNLASFKFVDGTTGHDTFNNIADGATVTGHGGNDTFLFKSALVSATITDFDSASDTITFPSTMFNHNPANVLAATNNDAHGNAVITVSATDAITLLGVDKAHLNASDFHFV